jgi:hypothetical protein
MTGLISFGGRSGSVCYQMWFTEHHPDMCGIGPTERWLEHAAWRFAHDMANESALYTGISGSFLREYATHAVRDDVVDRMNLLLGWDTRLRIYPILDAILELSRTREEGAWPRGKLVFVEPQSLERIPFLARFSPAEQPTMENIKHVRKLLAAVEQSELKLISDGRCVTGIADDSLPDFTITADFRGGHGFLKVVDDTLCSFADGTYQSTTRRANLVNLEEALLESDLDPETGNAVFKIIAALIHQAEDQKHGATLVLDLNHPPVAISGQLLSNKPWTCGNRPSSIWPNPCFGSTVPCISVPTCIFTGLPACWTAAPFRAKTGLAGPGTIRPCGSPPSMPISSSLWSRRTGRYPSFNRESKSALPANGSPCHVALSSRSP